MYGKRYPKIHVRSKNELAKRLSDNKMNQAQALELINDVIKNFDKYWKDHRRLSRPQEDKWVRDASYTKLGKLLKLINTRILSPHDDMLPDFIYGGISGRNHKSAVRHLLGRKRGRVLLKLDISRFYEQISQERVEQFFALKADCGKEGAKLLAALCCVPCGAKGSPAERRTIARGFSTSSRLAVWCNLDAFIKLERLVKAELKSKDPRIAIYVDDIGITASKVTKEDMMRLYPKIKLILESDAKQKLPLNTKKTAIVFHSGETYDIQGRYRGRWSFEHLGIQMNRTSLTLGSKTRWKLADITYRVKSAFKGQSGLRRVKKSINRYKAYIEKLK
jgi:hypothetical protein